MQELTVPLTLAKGTMCTSQDKVVFHIPSWGSHADPIVLAMISILHTTRAESECC